MHRGGKRFNSLKFNPYCNISYKNQMKSKLVVVRPKQKKKNKEDKLTKSETSPRQVRHKSDLVRPVSDLFHQIAPFGWLLAARSSELGSDICGV